jgi:hypothetical protein
VRKTVFAIPAAKVAAPDGSNAGPIVTGAAVTGELVNGDPVVGTAVAGANVTGEFVIGISPPFNIWGVMIVDTI